VSSELARCRTSSVVNACRLGFHSHRQRGGWRGVGNGATALCIGEQRLIAVVETMPSLQAFGSACPSVSRLSWQTMPASVWLSHAQV
jgi:hypothetical protein